MAKDDIYIESEQRLRRRIYYLITEKTQKLGEAISYRIARLFAGKVKANLRDYMHDWDYGPSMESRYKIKNLIDGIAVEKSTSIRGGYKTTIKNDDEGLLMFIEYGTGWLGDQFSYELQKTAGIGDSESVGWDYMINADDYVDGKYFIFNKDKKGYDPYIARTDFTPTRLTYKKYVRTKNGVVERTYKAKPNYSLIMSKGISPSFAIFNARFDIRNGLKSCKTMKEIENWLEVEESVLGNSNKMMEEFYGD